MIGRIPLPVKIIATILLFGFIFVLSGAAWETSTLLTLADNAIHAVDVAALGICAMVIGAIAAAVAIIVFVWGHPS